MNETTPKSTRYKTKWAVQCFRERQIKRLEKLVSTTRGSVYKKEDLGRVQTLEIQLKHMDALSLNYRFTKFIIQDVSSKIIGHYPARSIYGMICGLKRDLKEKNGVIALNPLDCSYKR